MPNWSSCPRTHPSPSKPHAATTVLSLKREPDYFGPQEQACKAPETFQDKRLQQSTQEPPGLRPTAQNCKLRAIHTGSLAQSAFSPTRRGAAGFSSHYRTQFQSLLFGNYFPNKLLSYSLWISTVDGLFPTFNHGLPEYTDGVISFINLFINKYF